MLGEGQNNTCRRQSYGYNKGLDKAVSNKGRLWVGHNICFSNHLAGFLSRKKIKAIYEGMKVREYEGVSRNVRKY